MFRKLSLSCRATSQKKALEKRYTNLGVDVNDVMKNEASTELLIREGLGGNKTRVETFEETIFKYMQENVALVHLYLKEPFVRKLFKK